MARSGASAEPAPDIPNFAAYSWTCGYVIPCIGRTLMTVDLSMIPAGALILDARLSLYADPACAYLGFYGQPTYGDDNCGFVRRITAPWDAPSVTWENKPTASKRHQLLLKKSSSDVQDYINQDVTDMVQDMIDYPSYGIMLRMEDEKNPYNSLIFGSGFHVNPALRPKLVITYATSGMHKKESEHEGIAWQAEVYPNPAKDMITFEFPFRGSQESVEVSVYTATGQCLRSECMSATSGYAIDISSLQAGLYFFRAENKSSHELYAGGFLKQ